jgi:hypothetical protein
MGQSLQQPAYLNKNFVLSFEIRFFFTTVLYEACQFTSILYRTEALLIKNFLFSFYKSSGVRNENIWGLPDGSSLKHLAPNFKHPKKY